MIYSVYSLYSVLKRRIGHYISGADGGLDRSDAKPSDTHKV